MKGDDMSDTVIMIVMWNENKLGWVNQRTDCKGASRLRREWIVEEMSVKFGVKCVGLLWIIFWKHYMCIIKYPLILCGCAAMFECQTAFIAFGNLASKVRPTRRGFYCQDESIRHSFQPETVTIPMVVGFCLITTLIAVWRIMDWRIIIIIFRKRACDCL